MDSDLDLDYNELIEGISNWNAVEIWALDVNLILQNVRNGGKSMKMCMDIAQRLIPLMFNRVNCGDPNTYLTALATEIDRVFIDFRDEQDYVKAKEVFLANAKDEIKQSKVKVGQKRTRSGQAIPTPEYPPSSFSEKDVQDIRSAFVDISKKPSMQESIYLTLFKSDIFLIDNELIRTSPSAVEAIYSKYTSGKLYLTQKEKEMINTFIETTYFKQPVESVIQNIRDEQLSEFLKNMNKHYKHSVEAQQDSSLLEKLFDQFVFCENIMPGTFEIDEGLKVRNTVINALLIETQKASNNAKERQVSLQKLGKSMKESYEIVDEYKTNGNVKIFGLHSWGTEVSFYVMENVNDSYLMIQVNSCQLPQNCDSMACLLTTYAAFKDFNHLLKEGIKPFLSLEYYSDESEEEILPNGDDEYERCKKALKNHFYYDGML